MRTDNRKLSHEVLEEIRIRSVKMVVKSRMKNTEVCEIMEVGIQMLSVWLGKYRKGWWAALKSKKNPGGKPKDPEKNLTSVEMRKLKKLLLCEPRDIKQLKLDLSLWTAALVAELIKKIFFKSLKEWQVRKILKDLGFTNQKPIFRAYQQSLEKVEQWRKVDRPRIEQEAQQEQREILYVDEAGFKSTEHRGTTWWLKWKTPIVTATGARFGINAISAISKNGVMKFMSYEGSFTTDTLIIFFEKIIYQSNKTKIPQKYTFILDGHPAHKTKKVQAWLGNHTVLDDSQTDPEKRIQPQILLYYLPPYSPELNPDEQVWWNIKQQMKGVISVSTTDIRRKVHNCLLRIQKKKALISAFFRHPEFV